MSSNLTAAAGDALITGASAGIGVEFARIFASEGYNVVLVARRGDRLEELARDLRARHAVGVEVIACDLGTAGGVAQVVSEVAARGRRIGVLVNNAGFGTFGPFDETPLDRQLAMMQLNMNALVELTYRFLPGMRAARAGGVLNVSSTAAFQPGPIMGVYFASKAFVLSLSEALSSELAGTGVTVSVLCPGPTHSEFGSVARVPGTKFVERSKMTAADVARAGYQGFVRGRAVVVPGFSNKLLTLAVRLAPRFAVRAVVQRMNGGLVRAGIAADAARARTADEHRPA